MMANWYQVSYLGNWPGMHGRWQCFLNTWIISHNAGCYHQLMMCIWELLIRLIVFYPFPDLLRNRIWLVQNFSFFFYIYKWLTQSLCLQKPVNEFLRFLQCIITIKKIPIYASSGQSFGSKRLWWLKKYHLWKIQI